MVANLLVSTMNGTCIVHTALATAATLTLPTELWYHQLDRREQSCDLVVVPWVAAKPSNLPGTFDRTESAAQQVASSRPLLRTVSAVLLQLWTKLVENWQYRSAWVKFQKRAHPA